MSEPYSVTNSFYQARKVKREFKKKKIGLYATVILNYANITYYWFSIITKYDVQFLTIHLK